MVSGLIYHLTSLFPTAVVKSVSFFVFELQPIPRAFETEHDLRNNPSRFFCDPNGKLWPVRIYHSVGRSDFGAGWRDLLLANGVSEGDKCIFEFVQDDVIQVHIIEARK